MLRPLADAGVSSVTFWRQGQEGAQVRAAQAAGQLGEGVPVQRAEESFECLAHRMPERASRRAWNDGSLRP